MRSSFVFFLLLILFSSCEGGSGGSSAGSKVLRHLQKVALVKEKRTFYQIDVAGQEIFINGGLGGLLAYHAESESTLIFQDIFSNDTAFRDVRVIQSTNSRILLFAVYFLPNKNHTGVGVFSFSDGKLTPLILYNSLKNISTKRICGSRVLDSGEIRVTTADLKQGIQDYIVDADSRVIVPAEPILVDDLPVMDTITNRFYRYVAADHGGLLLVDRNSGSIAKRYVNPLSAAQRLLFDGNLLILADRMNGIRFFNLDSKGVPSYLSQYDTTGDALELFLRKNRRELLIADGANGLLWLGIENPEEPVLYGQFMEINALVYDVKESPVFSGVMYASSGSAGLQVFKLVSITNKPAKKAHKQRPHKMKNKRGV